MTEMARHNEIGRIGEDVAARFLKSKGLEIICRNYSKPYGEIDIVARETSGLVRFVEVKSVSYLPVGRQVETDGVGDPSVSHGTGYRPEENVHPQKMRRLSRVINAYIVSYETDEWAFDVITVYIDQKARKSKVKWLKDIILDV